MVKSENVEVSSEELSTVDGEELVELGRASQETRGLFLGVFTELSILPLRFTN